MMRTGPNAKPLRRYSNLRKLCFTFSWTRPRHWSSHVLQIAMSLECAFRGLSLRRARLCSQCMRTFATSASRKQKHQSATAAFAGTIPTSSII